MCYEHQAGPSTMKNAGLRAASVAACGRRPDYSVAGATAAVPIQAGGVVFSRSGVLPALAGSGGRRFCWGFGRFVRWESLFSWHARRFFHAHGVRPPAAPGIWTVRFTIGPWRCPGKFPGSAPGVAGLRAGLQGCCPGHHLGM
jgi:hypothetical protein